MYKYALWIGIAIPAIQQLSGVNVIMYYAPTMFESQGDYKLVLTFVTTLLSFFSTFVSVFVTDKLGRRFLFIYGSLGCALGLLFSTIGYTNPNATEPVTYASKKVIDWIFNGGIFFFISAFGVSHGPVWYFIAFILAGFILQRYCLLHGCAMESLPLGPFLLLLHSLLLICCLGYRDGHLVSTSSL